MMIKKPENIVNKTFTSRLFWCLFILFVSGITCDILVQSVAWDFRNYHYYNPYALLHHRLMFDIAPAGFLTYVSPTLDVFHYGLTTLLPPFMANFLLGALTGISFYIAYEFTLLLQKNCTARQRFFFACLAMAFSLSAVTTFYQLGTWRGDGTASIVIMAALFILVKHLLAEKHIMRGSCLSALLLGIACGLKLSMLYCVPGFIAMFSVALLHSSPTMLRNKNRIVLLLQMNSIAGCIFLVGFFAVDGYWIWTLYHHFQNPIFPMFNTFFHSPYAPIAINHPTPINEHPHTLTQILLLPFHLAKRNNLLINYQIKDFHLAIVFSAALLLGGMWVVRYIRNLYMAPAVKEENNSSKSNTTTSLRDKSDTLLLWLSVFYFVSFYAWVLMFSVIRYLFPIQILSGVLLIGFVTRFPFSRFKQAIIIALLTLVCVVTTPYEMHRAIETHLSTIFRHDYLPGTTPKLPKNSIVVLANQPTAYLIPFFDPSIRFIAIRNLNMDPTNTNLMQQTANRLAMDTTHPHFVLLKDNEQDLAYKALETLHLTVDQTSCQPFTRGWRHFSVCRIVFRREHKLPV